MFDYGDVTVYTCDVKPVTCFGDLHEGKHFSGLMLACFGHQWTNKSIITFQHALIQVV